MADTTKVWCHVHETFEDVVDKPYKICFECSHVYNTPEDLVEAYNRMVAEMIKRDNEAHFMPMKSAEEIFFCQECLHDFVD